MEQAGLTFALVPGWQRRAVGHGGGGEISGGAVHLVGEGAVGQTLLLVPLADEAGQGELVVGREAGGVAEALRPWGAVLLDGTGLRPHKHTSSEDYCDKTFSDALEPARPGQVCHTAANIIVNLRTETSGCSFKPYHQGRRRSRPSPPV